MFWVVLDAKEVLKEGPRAPQETQNVAPSGPQWTPGEPKGALVQAKRSLFRKTSVSPAREHQFHPPAGGKLQNKILMKTAKSEKSKKTLLEVSQGTFFR